MTDQGLSADPDSGEFCIQEKYVKYDGGGATTVTCEADNGKMTFTIGEKFPCLYYLINAD